MVYNTIIILLVIINVKFLLNRNNYVIGFSTQDNIYLTEYDKLLAVFMGRDLKLRDRLSHFRHNPFIWKKMRYEQCHVLTQGSRINPETICNDHFLHLGYCHRAAKWRVNFKQLAFGRLSFKYSNFIGYKSTIRVFCSSHNIRYKMHNIKKLLNNSIPFYNFFPFSDTTFLKQIFVMKLNLCYNNF